MPIPGTNQRFYYVDAVAKPQLLIVTGGSWGQDPQPEEIDGVNAFVSLGGIYQPYARPEGVPTLDTADFLAAYGIRATYPGGQVPAIADGVVAGDSNAYITIGTARVDEWELSGAENARAARCRLNIGGVSGPRTASAVPAPDALASSVPMTIAHSTVEIDGSERDTQSWTLRVKNNNNRQQNWDTKASSAKRLANVEWSGREEIELEVATNDVIAMSLDADSLAVDIDAAIVLGDGTNTWTLTIGAAFTPRALDVPYVDPTGLVQYRQSFIAKAAGSSAILTQVVAP
jgi:hypothetical protein